ncbi:hypothetical protein [Pseudomonas tremae]|uniref:hypothetical protein n=1 Tax=Pseudomonas tremae TaxID=200454 RepID=UPI000463722E|nr:hypothetical protein [Pseudomonas tremae]
MNKKWLYGVAMFSALSQAAEPIKDKDKFEAEYVKCMQTGFADKCWTKTLSGHAAPWVDNEEKVLRDAEAAYVSWLQGQGIYKVHPGLKEIKAEVFDNRSYLLERDDGAGAAVWISFRQAKGKWYVYEVMASSADEFIRTALGMTRPREK